MVFKIFVLGLNNFWTEICFGGEGQGLVQVGGMVNVGRVGLP